MAFIDLIKNKFNLLHGYSMYEVLLTQEQFVYNDFFKRSVLRLDSEELIEKWKHPLVVDIKEKLQKEYNCSISSAFLNKYITEEDYCKYHQDTYQDVNIIFIISLGGARKFYTKHNETGEVIKYDFEDGDLMIFNDEFNKNHKHSVPKLKKYKDPRISIVMFGKYR